LTKRDVTLLTDHEVVECMKRGDRGRFKVCWKHLPLRIACLGIKVWNLHVREWEVRSSPVITTSFYATPRL